jgi:PAS domain S-box-containing protein
MRSFEWNELSCNYSFQHLVENANDIIYCFSTEGTITYLSPKFTEIFGYKTSELIGQSFYLLIHPNDLPICDDFLKDILQTGTHKSGLEFRCKLKDNNFFWFKTNISPIKDAADFVIGFQGILHDINEYKLVEQSLQQQSNILRMILDRMSDAVVVADEQEKFLFFNPAAERMFGSGVTDTNSEQWSEQYGLFLSDKVTPIAGNDVPLARAVKGEKVDNLEIFVRHAKVPSGLWAMVCGSPLRDENGVLKGGVVVCRDVTERKQTEEALFQLAAIVESSEDAIISKTLDGLILSWNAGAEKLFGYQAQEVIGQPVTILVPPDRINEEAEILEKLRRGEQIEHFETVRQRKDGTLIDISLTISPIKDTTGRIIGVSKIARDISTRKKAEVALRESEAELRQKATDLETTLLQLKRTQTQLVQQEKMSSLGQLVAGVAHEINNPVNFIYANFKPANEYIQNLLELLRLYQQHYPSPVPEIQDKGEEIDLDFLVEDLPKLLCSMEVGADRIKKIVLSLRNFSRMDEAEMKSVNIHEGIDSTLMILQNRLKAKHDHPEIEVIKGYGNLPLVECYAGQLNQVFMNIITNAIDALEERDKHRTFAEIEQQPSQIRICTQMVGSDKVQIRIVDNGLGIPESTQNQLFNPFFTTKPVGKGTGLGMSISYQIVAEKHGGSLWCHSIPGQSAEFVIEIPIRQSVG